MTAPVRMIIICEPVRNLPHRRPHTDLPGNHQGREFSNTPNDVVAVFVRAACLRGRERCFRP